MNHSSDDFAAGRSTRDVGGASCSAGIGTHATLPGSLSHSLFSRLIRWSAGGWCIHVTIDMSLRWSEEERRRSRSTRDVGGASCSAGIGTHATLHSAGVRGFGRIDILLTFHSAGVRKTRRLRMVGSAHPTGTLDIHPVQTFPRSIHPRRRRSILLRRDWYARHIAATLSHSLFSV